MYADAHRDVYLDGNFYGINPYTFGSKNVNKHKILYNFVVY